MVHEAKVESEEHGLVAKGEGWYVVNARDVRWRYSSTRGAYCDIEGDTDWPQFGANLYVLEPGQPMAMYHWEADQEGFFVLSGEAVLVVEGEERPLEAVGLRPLPEGTNHVIVGAGSGRPRCSRSAHGSTRSTTRTGAATSGRDRAASRRGCRGGDDGSEVAYADVVHRTPTRFREEWLPS